MGWGGRLAGKDGGEAGGGGGGGGGVDKMRTKCKKKMFYLFF